jgi:hypothetical protein
MDSTRNSPRTCLCCGEILTRKRYGRRLEDKSIYEKRKFCSISCANARTGVKERKQVTTKNQPKGKPAKHESPLEFMLRVMNDPQETLDMRAKMAIAAAKYVHRRASAESGKKAEQAGRASKAAERFAPAPGPRVVPISSLIKL